MTASFWINLIVCLGSCVAAWLDHGQTLKDFRSALGHERRRKLIKLTLLWGVPVGTFIATLLTGVESAYSDRKAENQTKQIVATSNAMHSATQQLSAVQAQQRWRRISKEQRAQIMEALKNIPKGDVIVWTCGASEETLQYSKDFVSIFTDAGFPGKSRTSTGDTTFVGINLLINYQVPSKLMTLLQIFRAAGIECEGYHKELPANTLEIRIGAREIK